jgi:hypothetical protein
MARMTDGVSKPQSTASLAPDWGLAPLERRIKPNSGGGDAHELDWAPAGPGWHDSSWLLRQGLEVTEHRSASLLESVFRALQMQSPPNESALRVPA